MTSKAVKILELDKILDQLKSLTVSSLGKDRIDEMTLLRDLAEVNHAQDETEEATQILLKRSTPPLGGVVPVTRWVQRAARGGTLSMGELLRVGDALRGARRLKDYMHKDEADRDSAYPILEGHISSLWTKESLEKKIERAIISEEEMADDASIKLKKIRQAMVSKRKAVRDKLEAIVTSQDYQNALQDRIVTLREGRYVVPVKQSRKKMIPGLVHDMSSSGQTLFIEPMAVVELNNELRSLELEEREEIQRILRDLSQEVGENPYEFQANELVLRELDYIFAKGKLALDQGAIRPQINDQKYTSLEAAKHPLLDPKTVVPINIDLGKDYSSLIITGPNTGGKTVSLKTLGLLTLMTQYGLHIPARESSQVGIFNQVFADIGDEQSIEQSLSTFSSHMLNIVEILNQVSSDDLVLFDELGSGTDPTEGAALALSILETMRKKEIRTMATTHYNQLKTYALSTQGVQNASMEFDVETLSPTYRLIIGLPGKSNAFEISRRLGLSDEVLDQASHYLKLEDVELEKVLATIEKERFYLEKERREIRQERLDLDQKHKVYDKEVSRVRKERDQIIREAKDKATRILEEAKEEADLAVSEIRSVGLVLEKEKARSLQESQDLLRQGLKNVRLDSDEGIRLKKASQPAKALKPGDTVYAQSLGVEGTVLEIDETKDQVLLQAGIMKMTLPRATLVKKQGPKEAPAGSIRTKQVIQDKQKSVKSEIDIRGKNFEEARPEIDQALDDAYLTGLSSLRIIHGKGTGSLRKKVRDYLKAYPIVSSYHEAKANEGGSGVTYANFKGEK
ncbi:MAG: endonuclease MutS2 [Tissierellia bacterium]|nr:endonuclease MutS2 [Tissierellia bacterium]